MKTMHIWAYEQVEEEMDDDEDNVEEAHDGQEAPAAQEDKADGKE